MLTDEFKRRLLEMRVSQLLINDLLRAGAFKVPIHLALGHELLALAVCQARKLTDPLVLTHRNVHYQLAMRVPLGAILQEATLGPDGLAGGVRGIMNLDSREFTNLYTSSILGNNLSVACGIALADRVRQAADVTWVVTGDGAIEEGAFAESLLNAASLTLPIIFLVEDNGWSLATSISERRCEIDLKSLAQAYGLSFFNIDAGRWDECLDLLSEARSLALTGRPCVVGADVSTLGGRWVEAPERAEGRRLINYHAGVTPDGGTTRFSPLVEDELDPLGALFASSEVDTLTNEILSELDSEIASLEVELPS